MSTKLGQAVPVVKVHVCLTCEQHSVEPIVECEPSECDGGPYVAMSLLVWEIRNVEAALMGIPCTVKRNGGRHCAKNGSGFQCSSCGGLRSARRALDEALKAEPIPALRRAS